VSIGVYLEVTLVNGRVPLMKAGRELFVRYEQIVLVSPMG
jgi:hypothetical protein